MGVVVQDPGQAAGEAQQVNRGGRQGNKTDY